MNDTNDADDADDTDGENSKRIHGEAGRFEPKYSTEEFVEAVEELGPAAGTQEVADRVGCRRDTAYRRLVALEDQGVIETRKVGTTRLWSVAE